MAPTKGKSTPSKGSKASGKPRAGKPSTSAASSSKKKSGPRPKAVEQKSKSITRPLKKKRREYSEAELKIPKLNTITPAGVQKPKGKKKGKVFVDDQESMMTILAMVNADKEGQIESKMMRARQMEEIRQARQKEMEARAAEKKDKLESTKNSLRKGKKVKGAAEDESAAAVDAKPARSKKRVSFG